MRLNDFIFHRLSKKEQAFLFTILGPSLFIFSTLLFLLKVAPFLSLIAFFSCCGIAAAWRYSLKGAISSIAVLLLTTLISPLFFNREMLSWEILGVLSLSVALVVIGLSTSEYRKVQQDIDQESDEKVSLLQRDYENELKSLKRDHQETLHKLDHKEQSIDILSERIKEKESFNASLQSDCEHRLLQIKQLNEETLDLQRQIFEMEARKVDDMQLNNLYQKNLKELNALRVDYYQQKLLLEHAKKQLSLRGKEEEEQISLEPTGVTDIEVLEEERTSLKKYYKQQVRDYKGIQEKLKAIFSIEQVEGDTISYDGFAEYYASLKSSFQDMTKHLQETRTEIFKTEGNIIELKNKHQIGVDPSSTQNYLAIADQECLRLEDENNVLLDLLESLFLAYTKKGPS